MVFYSYILNRCYFVVVILLEAISHLIPGFGRLILFIYAR